MMDDCLLRGVGRSGRWPQVRARWLEAHPRCAFCGTREDVTAHHKLPVSWPGGKERELDESNLITLCGTDANTCHLIVGHLGDFRSRNPLVEEWCQSARTREYPQGETMPYPLTFGYPGLAEATPAFMVLKDKFIDRHDIEQSTLLRALWTASGFGLSVFVPDKPPLILEGPALEQRALEDLQTVCNTLSHPGLAFGSFDWRTLLKWLDTLLQQIIDSTK